MSEAFQQAPDERQADKPKSTPRRRAAVLLGSIAALAVIVAAVIGVVSLLGEDDSASTDAVATASTPPAESTSTSAISVPSDLAALASQYVEAGRLNYNCDDGPDANMTGIQRAARGICEITASQNLQSFRATAATLSPSQAQGDLLAAIDRWMATYQDTKGGRCVTSSGTALCDYLRGSLTTQWNGILRTVGYQLPK